MLLMRRDVDGDEIASAVPKSNSNSAKFSSEASSIQEHHLPPHAAKGAEASSREKVPEIIAIETKAGEALGQEVGSPRGLRNLWRELIRQPHEKDSDPNVELVETLFNLINANYQNQFDSRYVGRTSMAHLTDAIHYAAEWSDESHNGNLRDLNTPLDRLWSRLQSNLSLPIHPRLQFAAKHNFSLVRWIARWALHSRVIVAIESLAAYARALRAVMTSNSSHVHLAPCFPVLQKQIHLAEMTLSILEQAFPAISHIACNALTARAFLAQVRESLTHLFSKGLLRDRDFERLTSDLDDKITSLGEIRFHPFLAQDQIVPEVNERSSRE